MNKILEELTKKLNNVVDVEDVVTDEFEKLETLKRNNTFVTCTITGYKKSSQDIQYFMVLIEDLKRYTGIVKIDDVLRNTTDKINDVNLDDYIGKEVICRIHEVFADTSTAIVSRNFDDIKLMLMGMVDKVDLEPNVRIGKLSKYDMKKLLTTVELPVVMAKVVEYVKEISCVVVDIYELGIRGRVPASLWDWSFISEDQMEADIKGKEYINVALLGYGHADKTEGKPLHFVCSRIISPENDIFYRIEKRFTVNSVIAVECEAAEEKYFWGRNELFEGNILCYYDDEHGNVNSVTVGEKYLVKVKKVSDLDRKFTCSFVKKMEVAAKKSITEI